MFLLQKINFIKILQKMEKIQNVIEDEKEENYDNFELN